MELPADLPPPPLSVLALELTLRLDDPGSLPRWKGSLLHGGLGHALRRAMCQPDCVDPGACPHAPDGCPFRTLFNPAVEQAHSQLHGIRDLPRPYAIMPPLDDAPLLAAGDTLRFGLTLMGQAISFLPHVLLAFDYLGAMGLGQERMRARLIHATTLTLDGAPEQAVWPPDPAAVPPRPLDGAALVAAAQQLPPDLTLHFMTPLRIRQQKQFIRRPECHVLIRTALRRISLLSEHIGAGRWDVPFGTLIRAAEQVPLVHDTTHWVDWTRTSARSGELMNWGGLVGAATYRDVPSALRVPLLLGSLIHIGKACVFGHGGYRITPA